MHFGTGILENFHHKMPVDFVIIYKKNDGTQKIEGGIFIIFPVSFTDMLAVF